MNTNADGYLTDEDNVDQVLFEQLYAEGLKESSKQAEKNLPIPKFYSKVSHPSYSTHLCSVY